MQSLVLPISVTSSAVLQYSSAPPLVRSPVRPGQLPGYPLLQFNRYALQTAAIPAYDEALLPDAPQVDVVVDVVHVVLDCDSGTSGGAGQQQETRWKEVGQG